MRLIRNKGVLLGLTLLIASSNVMASDYDNHWAKTAIDQWRDYGVVVGYGDDIFKPNQVVTRAEFAAILTRVFGFTETTGGTTYFENATDAGKWYIDAMNKVGALELMHIEGVFFEPNLPLTREEAAYAIAKAYELSGAAGDGVLSFKDQNSIADWSKEAVATMISCGYLKGYEDGSFKPQGKLTRAELVTMLHHMTGKLIQKPGVYTENVKGNVIINASGVTLKNMTIDGDLYIAQGARNKEVNLQNVKVTGTVYINSGKVTMTGTFNKVQIGAKTEINFDSGSIKEVIVNKIGATLKLGENAKVSKITQHQPIRVEHKQPSHEEEAKPDIKVKGAGIYINDKYVALPVEGQTIVLDIPELSKAFKRGDQVSGLIVDTNMKDVKLSSSWGTMIADHKYTFEEAEAALGIVKEAALEVGHTPAIVTDYIFRDEVLTIGSLLDSYAKAQQLAADSGIVLKDTYDFVRYMSSKNGKTTSFTISIRLN